MMRSHLDLSDNVETPSTSGTAKKSSRRKPKYTVSGRIRAPPQLRRLQWNKLPEEKPLAEAAPEVEEPPPGVVPGQWEEEEAKPEPKAALSTAKRESFVRLVANGLISAFQRRSRESEQQQRKQKELARVVAQKLIEDKRRVQRPPSPPSPPGTPLVPFHDGGVDDRKSDSQSEEESSLWACASDPRPAMRQDNWTCELSTFGSHANDSLQLRPESVGSVVEEVLAPEPGDNNDNASNHPTMSVLGVELPHWRTSTGFQGSPGCASAGQRWGGIISLGPWQVVEQGFDVYLLPDADAAATEEQRLVAKFPPQSLTEFEHRLSAGLFMSEEDLLPPATRNLKDRLLKDDKGRYRPLFLCFICLVQLHVFLFSMYFNNCNQHSDRCIGAASLGRFAFEPMSTNPLFGPSPKTLLSMGAKSTNRVVREGQVWRLLTAIYLHGGVFHLAGNIVGTMAYGYTLERDHGILNTLCLYNMAGVVSMLWSSIMRREAITVGASGAALGLLGCNFSNLALNWRVLDDASSQLLTLLAAVGVEAFLGLAPYIDNVSHIAGFATGLLYGLVFCYHPLSPIEEPVDPLAEVIHGREAVDREREARMASLQRRKARERGHQFWLMTVAAPLLCSVVLASCVMLFTGVDLSTMCNCANLDCQDSFLWTCPQYTEDGDIVPQCNMRTFETAGGPVAVLQCDGRAETGLEVTGEQSRDEVYISLLCEQQCA